MTDNVLSVLTVRVDHDSPNHYVQVVYRNGDVASDSVYHTRADAYARAEELATTLNTPWEHN